MNLFARRPALVSAAFLATVAVVQAHPGHEGDHGGLEWDFSHLTGHPAATLICSIVLVAAAIGAARLLQAVATRPEQAKSKHRR